MKDIYLLYKGTNETLDEIILNLVPKEWKFITKYFSRKDKKTHFHYQIDESLILIHLNRGEATK